MNIRSIMGKRDAFDAIIDSCEANMIAVTETWLNAHLCDNEIFTMYFKVTEHLLPR